MSLVVLRSYLLSVSKFVIKLIFSFARARFSVPSSRSMPLKVIDLIIFIKSLKSRDPCPSATSWNLSSLSVL